MHYPSTYLKFILAQNEETLAKQSRSFAIPVLNLDEKFKKPIMVQYNLNKTIDTIEDHVNITLQEKRKLIQHVCTALKHGSVSADIRCKLLPITPKDEHFVFQHYSSIVHLFNTLSASDRELGYQWTKTMADGMCQFLDKDIQTIEELNEYCYYVAGTVGLYLSNLLMLHENVPKTQQAALEKTAVPFGLFLQKLNVIRDFKEDQSKRKHPFWPQNLLDKHGQIGTLNLLCHNTLKYDASMAIQYYKALNGLNPSFRLFVRFILFSGLEYIKLLKNNRKVFDIAKIKLPKIFITHLYQKLSKMSENDFIETISHMLEEEIQSLEATI